MRQRQERDSPYDESKIMWMCASMCCVHVVGSGAGLLTIVVKVHGQVLYKIPMLSLYFFFESENKNVRVQYAKEKL